MAFVRFAGLILSILLVLQALRGYSAHAVQGRKMKGNMLMATKENISRVKMGLDHDSSAGVAGEQGLGGRKMVTKREDLPEKVNDKNVSKESLGGHQHHLNNQNHGKVSEEKTAIFVQNDKSSRVAEEANEREVTNMMHKDYKGMSNGRRKPPINNHQTTN